MNILVLNVGSSSIKYTVFSQEKPLLSGVIEEIGGSAHHIITNVINAANQTLHNLHNNTPHGSQAVAASNHHEALRLIFFRLRKERCKLHAIGHRVVHGGMLRQPVKITKKVLENLRKISELAPLHNPPQIAAIEACMKLFSAPQVAVFDTSYHNSMPLQASTYAIPIDLARKHGIRRYGFHGISHHYVVQEACKLLKKSERRLRLISCHLGNGCSMTAIALGKVMDTSMGFTPLEGLMMGTRSGDIDPSVIPFLAEREHLSSRDVERMLNFQSGLLGVSGVSNDVRVLLQTKTARAKLALDVFVYRVVKYIGAYTAAMNGVDVIIFTAGIGEHATSIREQIVSRLSYLGVLLDKKKNAENASIISDAKSKVAVLVVPTNEALMIARETITALRK